MDMLAMGSPITTLEALAGIMEGNTTSQEVKERCVKALSDVGAPQDYCDFFADVLQHEYDMNSTLHRLQKGLCAEQGSPPPDMLLRATQDLTKNFNIWRANITTLEERSVTVPELTLDSQVVNQSKVLKALCSLETSQVHLTAGDELTITDMSQPNRLKVRNQKGDEGFVPALCCILPTPDKNALTALERLRVQLLVQWTEAIKKIKRLLMDCLRTNAEQLSTDLSNVNGKVSNKDRATRRLKRVTDMISQQSKCDLSKLHQSLYSLERELTTWTLTGIDVNQHVETVANLDKAVLCYQMFRKQWLQFRKTLQESSRPIKIMESWDSLKPVNKGKNFKFYEMKTTVENVETREEITYLTCNDVDSLSYCSSSAASSDFSSRRESVETDQITSATREESKKFVIRGVINPSTRTEISFADAVALGIVDPERGLYRDTVTGGSMPIPEAMNTGMIKVEFTSTRKGEERTKAVGLITVKTMIDDRKYAVKQVIDSRTGERVDPQEAELRGILSMEDGEFCNHLHDYRLSLDEAIDEGWVIVEYEDEEEEPRYEIKTYAVNAVVDQKARKKVPFQEAVRRGLIERDTGNYVNNVTNERIYVTEAIKRGFLKAKVVDNPSDLDVDAENAVVIEKMDKLKSSVLRPVGVINAFKRAGAQQP